MEEASSIRQRLLKLLPWVITLAIFIIIFRRVPVPELLEALRQARLLPYLALMAPYSMIYCLIDTFVLTQAVTWFHQPVRYARILPVRAAAYILSLLNPGLGQGGTAFYLHRREGMPFLEMVGTIIFLVVIEFGQLALYAAIGIFIVQPQLGAIFAPFYVVFIAAFAIALTYVRHGFSPLVRLLQATGAPEPGGPRKQLHAPARRAARPDFAHLANRRRPSLPAGAALQSAQLLRRHPGSLPGGATVRLTDTVSGAAGLPAGGISCCLAAYHGGASRHLAGRLAVLLLGLWRRGAPAGLQSHRPFHLHGAE